MVAQAYKPSYLGGEDREDGSLRAAWANSSKVSISTNKLSMVAYICEPSKVGGHR
jgi:hypothetical protein